MRRGRFEFPLGGRKKPKNLMFIVEKAHFNEFVVRRERRMAWRQLWHDIATLLQRVQEK
jgi:hypothetical protein